VDVEYFNYADNVEHLKSDTITDHNMVAATGDKDDVASQIQTLISYPSTPQKLPA
jgi:hypothetical protein